MGKFKVVLIAFWALIGGALLGQASAQSGSAPALTWPLTLEVGQRYTAKIQGVNTWNISLSARASAAYTGALQMA